MSESQEIAEVEVVEEDPRGLIPISSEIDIQIQTAHKFPRSIERFKKNALTIATNDMEVAASCFYAIPRAGTTIEGPSVRLAEIVAGSWGNLRAGSEVLDIGDTHVTVRGFAHDLETNFAVSLQLRRRITNKHGKRYSDDMIQNTANAASAIAFRNALFKVVPFSFVQQIYNSCRQVAVGDAKTLATRRKAMFDHFQKMGVTSEKILAFLGKEGPDDIDLKDMETLFGISTAIKEGDITVDEAFPEIEPVEEKTKTGKLKDKIAAKKTDKDTPDADVPDSEFGREPGSDG